MCSKLVTKVTAVNPNWFLRICSEMSQAAANPGNCDTSKVKHLLEQVMAFKKWPLRLFKTPPYLLGHRYNQNDDHSTHHDVMPVSNTSVVSHGSRSTSPGRSSAPGLLQKYWCQIPKQSNMITGGIMVESGEGGLARRWMLFNPLTTWYLALWKQIVNQMHVQMFGLYDFFYYCWPSIAKHNISQSSERPMYCTLVQPKETRPVSSSEPDRACSQSHSHPVCSGLRQSSGPWQGLHASPCKKGA